MKFKDCKKDMRMSMKRPGDFKTRIGTFVVVGVSPDESVLVRWDDTGETIQYTSSIAYMSPLSERAEELAFFAKTPEGSCPCGIPRKSGRCQYH